MGHTMTAQQPYPDFNKEKVTDSSENPVGDKGAVIILGGFNISIKHLSPDVVSSGFQPLHTFLNSLSRFIRQPKRFRPFDYACVSVGLLQSPAADCIVRYSGLYSPLPKSVIIFRSKGLNRPYETAYSSLC